ncbi:hypothetical protein [Streptomyces sp. NBC_00989]|uniref:hypothetical protein n=1 Tax=Streptomyces sp. NBC_00989 TaxID=2903705 RepID=UPI00386909D1|nr:hypothetical protein OG714_43860 [Streptomyces sp. NBC_00989]
MRLPLSDEEPDVIALAGQGVRGDRDAGQDAGRQQDLEEGMSPRPALAAGRPDCHDQAVVNLSKIVRRGDTLLDLMGPAVGGMLLAAGLGTWRGGGSVAWPLAGAAVLLVNV